MDEIKLDKFEEAIEQDILNFTPVPDHTKKTIEKVIDKTNEKKSISLRLRKYDLDRLKQIAAQEGMPYQTLLASIIHKYITDQLVDKRSIIKGLQLLKSGNWV